MYAERLRAYVKELGNLAGLSPDDVPLLEESLACYLALFARVVQGEATPRADLLTASLRLALLTRSLVLSDASGGLDGVHYLVAMGYEQGTASLARVRLSERPDDPLENDDWYRLLLATLHYLAGGYRVQALCTRRAVADAAGPSPLYASGHRILTAAFEGGGTNASALERDVAALTRGHATASESMAGLLLAIRHRTDVLLSHLGEHALETWGQRHELDPTGTDFWGRYLRRLRERGFTSFTREQGHFDEWLGRDRDLLVQLPTGAGKSIIGELLTALHLAAGAAVVWLLPTRALVRQVKRDLRSAFSKLGVDVEELPTTEDALPLFAEEAPVHRQVAVTTPERLAALARANPASLTDVRLIVFDEAHLLLERTRGVTAEHVLRVARAAPGGCRLTLMSGLQDVREPLERTMRALGATPRVLVSEVRPTRRIYGVVTDEPHGPEHSRVSVLVHPPSSNAAHPDVLPYAVQLRPGKRGPSDSKTDIAARLARSVLDSGLRSVFFLSSRRSAESQARTLAQKAKTPAGTQFRVPKSATARLRLELGRQAVVETTAPHRVAAHHSGLTPLEQHLVERWVDAGEVRTVFATPTLAQGINLPFNLSVVGYTDRFNQNTRKNEPVPAGEIMNMLGRAGRAGKVPDGLCLLALESPRTDRRRLMRRSGSVYFAEPVSRGAVGLAALLSSGYQAIGAPEWPLELSGVRSFSDAQTFLSLALRIAATGVEDAPGVGAFLEAYPSVSVIDARLRERLATAMASLIAHLRAILANDPVALQITARAGLPPEYCAAIASAVATAPVGEGDYLEWSDNAVSAALARGSARAWHRDLFAAHSQDTVLLAIREWRSGKSVSALERILVNGKVTRAHVGEFLNHQMSLLAQFWAAVPVAAEARGRADVLEATRPYAALVRDGVPTVDALVWLRALGGLDRVLAKGVAEASPLATTSLPQKQRAARKLVTQWRSGRAAPPSNFAIVLEDVLADIE